MDHPVLLFVPEFHDSKRLVAVADPDADGPQDDVQIVDDEYLESFSKPLQEHGSAVHGHRSAGDADLHEAEAF